MIAAMCTIGKCEDFYNGTTYDQATIVMTPLRIVEIWPTTGDRGHRIVWGCSRYASCQNLSCEFSKKARDERKEAREAERV